MADPVADPYDLDAANARFEAADDVENEAGFWDAVGKARLAQGEAMQYRPEWVTRLPKNVGVGAYKAALNSIETLTDAANEVAASAVESSAVPVAPPPSIRELAPEFYESAHAFGDEISADNNLSDDIVQGVVQFALPFAAWMKGLGAAGMAGKVATGVAAETATAATAFGPHDGRLADLVQLGRQAEGKFGDVLRSISPDGSVLNSYINYMTDRENEGEWEGRLKNAVDSLAGTAALAGVLKGAATGFKVAGQVATSSPKVGPAAQRGAVGVDPPKPPVELTDIERARALKNTVVEEGGEHIVLEGDTVNQDAIVVPLKPRQEK